MGKKGLTMKKLLFVFTVIFVLFAINGCKPKYVAAESMDEIYSMAIEELKKANTIEEIKLANLKIKHEILEAQNWYLSHDRNNPRVKLLEEMLSITE
jgi:outer membrane protein assembly factor BamD (BamD/ComL family)